MKGMTLNSSSPANMGRMKMYAVRISARLSLLKCRA